MSVCLILSFLMLPATNAQTLIYSWTGTDLAGWTTTGEVQEVTDTQYCVDSLCALLPGSAEMSRSLSTTNYHTIQIQTYINSFHFETGDWCYVAYSTNSGTNKQTVNLLTVGQSAGTYSVDVQNTAEFNDQTWFTVYFGTTADRTVDECYFDSIQIFGTEYTASPTAAPIIAGNPTTSPTNPTAQPSVSPTTSPINAPSADPSASPTLHPTANPTVRPTPAPTVVLVVPETPTATDPSLGDGQVDDINNTAGHDTNDGNEDEQADVSTAEKIESFLEEVMYGLIGASIMFVCCVVVLCVFWRRKKDVVKSKKAEESVKPMEVQITSQVQHQQNIVKRERDELSETDDIDKHVQARGGPGYGVGDGDDLITIQAMFGERRMESIDSNGEAEQMYGKVRTPTSTTRGKGTVTAGGTTQGQENPVTDEGS